MALQHAGRFALTNGLPLSAKRIRTLTAALWCAVAASAVYWAMQWFTVPRADPPPSAPQIISNPRAAAATPLRVWFGGADAKMPTVRITGLIAAAPQRSTAILSIAGASPKAFHIGQEIAPGVTLVAVSANGVQLRQVDGSSLDVAAAPPSKVPGIAVVDR